MMHRPLGAFNSPNYHHVVLQNWQRAAKMPIGLEGWAGLQFFVTTRPSLGFCIEHRGPNEDPWFSHRLHFPFDATDRGSRRLAFARALLSWNGEYLLGDYPGKVPLWKRIPEGYVPSFGTIIRMQTHTAKSNYLDYIDSEAEDIWKLWVRALRQHKAAPDHD